MSREKFKDLIVIIVLFAILAITAAVAASSNRAVGDQMTYLPVILNGPTATPTPTAVPMAYFQVSNNTGGTLCIEVINSGLGRQCSSAGSLLYGPFTPGTYTFTASTSSCTGTYSDTRYFYAGYNYDGFECG